SLKHSYPELNEIPYVNYPFEQREGYKVWDQYQAPFVIARVLVITISVDVKGQEGIVQTENHVQTRINCIKLEI
ncbi:10532_t:CDS:1, partial [Ambispora gerdemannii]